MSAVWRKAVNLDAAKQAWARSTWGERGAPRQDARGDHWGDATPGRLTPEGLPDYSDQDAPRWLKWVWQRIGGAARVRPRVRARLSLGRNAVLHLPDRRAVARARTDRALAHVPRRLRRDGVARADDHRGDRRLHGRRSSARAAPPRSASAGRGGSRVPIGLVDRGGVRHLHRLALGPHRRHLHHHDHARDRRRVLLPHAAELQRVQRLPGAAEDLSAEVSRPQLARPDRRSTTSPCSGRSPGTSSSSTWCARRSASRCRASGTTRGA